MAADDNESPSTEAEDVCVHVVQIFRRKACLSFFLRVFRPITLGGGKSFHFLDESPVSQEPRDLLLPPHSAPPSFISSFQSPDLRHQPFHFAPSSPTFLFSSSYQTTLPILLRIHSFLSLSPPSAAESALPFCSPLQTHKRTDLHFSPLTEPISEHLQQHTHSLHKHVRDTLHEVISGVCKETDCREPEPETQRDTLRS